MPTIRHNGFQLRIYSNDHGPAHVHVIKSGGEMVISLGNQYEKPKIRKILSPMKTTEMRNALEAVKEKQTELIEKWRDTHER